MGQSVCKCCNCTSSQDAKRRNTKIYPQRPLSVDCVWTQGSSLPSSIHRRTYLSSDSDFHSMETSMGEDDTYLKKGRDDVGSTEVITEIFLGSAFGGDLSDELPLFLKKLKDITVRIGTNSRLIVELECRSDFKVTWYRNDNQILANDEYKIVNEGNIYALEFACVSIQDNGHWTCSAESRKGRVTSSCYLQVIVPKSYKKPVFYEELEAVLTDEGTVSLQCKVVGVPTPVLRWFKDGSEIKAGDIFALVANSRDPISLGTYTCEASNCMGKVYSSSGVKVNSKSSLSPNVQEVYNIPPTGQPPIFTQELKNEKIKIGESFILSSKIAVPPWPKAIKWQNPQEQYVDTSNPRFKDLADGLGGYMLEIISSEECDKGTWKCIAVSGDNSTAVSSCDLQLTIPKNYRKPYFVEKLRAVLTEDGLVSFECKVVGYPTPHLRWFKDGSELRAGDIYQLTGVSSLGSYLCIAKNCMGESRSEAELTVDDIKQQLSHEETMMLSVIRQPPKFIKKLISSEAPINSPFKFTVQVQMPPTPKLSWFKDDSKLEIDGKKYIQTNETQGVFHLNVLKLEFEDQSEWKCVASNEFGRTECSSFLKLIIPKHFKKPKFLENLRAVLTENGIVNLECKVIGVPQPTLKWFKDGVELNPGDIHKIMSGQDGTCCLGLYTCEAHNCMGSITSSASIHGIEDATLVKPKLRKLSLSTINEEDTFRTADDEQSLPIDQPHELSYSFDGKEISVSYYDTPDLTQEEAIQIIEMYADQLSEHISEHNVLELPPLRIVKETSTASNILMEGVVIDIVPEYFTVAEDDLRTEVGIEDISVIEDSIFSSQSSGRLRLNSDSRRNVDDKNYEIRSISESIQSPDLYYSLSESKKDDLSLPVSPVSRMSVEPETETYMSAKSSNQFGRRSSIKKTYFQDSPDRPQSATGQSHTSEETGDIMPDDDSILRHNFQFLTVLLSNNLTDIQQRLCYIEREMFLNSLKQQSDINESNFKDIGGLIQSIQELRTFFLSFKQKKNGDFPYTFVDLNHIAVALQTNIDLIHTSIINNPNLAVQKNNVKIVYQVGETLVNVLDLISDIIKLDTFELCKKNVTQTEKQKLINMVLDTRDELNELVIVTHDLFIDTQDITMDVTDTRKTVDTVDEIMLKLDTDETSNEGFIQEQLTKTLGSETQADETVPVDTKDVFETKEIREEKITIEKQEQVTTLPVDSTVIQEEKKIIETELPTEKHDNILIEEEKKTIEKQSEKQDVTSLVVATTEIQEEKKVAEKQLISEKPLVTLPDTKDIQEEKKPEKQVIEIEIGLDKKEAIEKMNTYQEEKIQDTLFDIELVKPLFETISELKSPEINVTELFENQTVKNLLVNILNVEKDIIQNQLKEIRLLELDETELKKISEFETNTTLLKNQLGKIAELEGTLAKDKIPEKDITSKEKIKNIMSIEWLEQKQSELKSYLQTISEPQKSIIQTSVQILEPELPPKEQINKIGEKELITSTTKQDNELQILNDLIELYDLQSHYSTITNDQLWDMAEEFQQHINDESYEIKIKSIENNLQDELNQNQLKQLSVSVDTRDQIATQDTINDLQDQIMDVKVKKFALYLVSDLKIHQKHPQSTKTIYKALVSELPQILEHKKHKINLQLELNADKFLNKLKQDFLEIEELKNYSESQSKQGKSLFNQLKSLCGKYNLSDLDTEENILSTKLEKITKEKEKQPQNKLLIEDEKSIKQDIYNIKIIRILEKDLKAVENKNLTLDPIQVLENKHDQIINSINLVKQTLNQKVLNLNDLKSYTKNDLPVNNLKEIIQNVTTNQKNPSFETQLHADEINLDIQANEIKSQILFLEESIQELTEIEDKNLEEKHLTHLQEEYKNIIQKLMHTQISQIALENLKDKSLNISNISRIINLIEQKQNTLKHQLSELNTLEGATVAGSASQLDLTNDEKIVILMKLQKHFASIPKTEKFDFLNEISTNYNNEEYVTHLNKEIENLTTEMHEINIQKVLVKNVDQKTMLEANEQTVENKLLHAKIKQLAIAKLSELQEIQVNITEDLKKIETIIPNILQEQEILIKSEIEYSKPTILQDFPINQQEELTELDTLTEQQSNLNKLKEHFNSVIQNEISEIVEELASNYKNKGKHYADVFNSEEIQLKDKINDLKLQKYNIELLSDSVLEQTDTIDSVNTSEKVKVIDAEISTYETKLLTSQIKKLALAKVVDINSQTEKLEDLFEDALLSLPNILEEEEKLLQISVETKTEALESVQATKHGEKETSSSVTQQIVKRQDLQEIGSAEAQRKLENIHKLKQYFDNVVANDMTEIVEELISNSKDHNYATELNVDEVQIKGKINYLAKWLTYNLEKLSTIPLDEVDDIAKKESILEKVNTLQQEINLHEEKLLKTQIKIMALAKVDEIIDKSKPLEDLFQDAMLNIPNALQKEEQLIYTATKVEILDVKLIPESNKLTIENRTIKLREQIKAELNDNNDEILKLRQHTANFNDVEINKIVEELNLNARDKDDYPKRLKSEEERLKERIKDLKWQRYNLERLSSMSSDKSENMTDILETAKILEHEISYNETKLLNTQIKKIMLVNVAEVVDHTENLAELLQGVLLNLSTELQNDELLSKPIPKISSISDSSVTPTETLTKEYSQEQAISQYVSLEDNPQENDKITKTISVDETKDIQTSENKVIDEDKILISENKETGEIKVDADKLQTAEDQKKPKEAISLGKTKDIIADELETMEQKEIDIPKVKEMVSPKETKENIPQALEKKKTGNEKAEEVNTTKEITEEKSQTLEKKKTNDEEVKQITSPKETVESQPLPKEIKKSDNDKEIISTKETIEKESQESEKKKTTFETTKKSISPEKTDVLDKLQNIAKLKQHFASVTKYEIAEVAEELMSETKDTAYAEKLEAEEEKLKCRIDDLKWQQNYLVRLSKIPTEEFDDVSEKGDIVRKVKKLEREITSNEEKLLDNQIKQLAFAQIKNSYESCERIEDLFEDALLNIPNILREEERILNNPSKPTEDVHLVVESKATEEVHETLSTDNKLEIIATDSLRDKSGMKLPADNRSKLEEKVSEKDINQEMLSKLIQHHATIAKTEMSELLNELTSNAQNENYAKQLDNDEVQLKAKINDLKWQRYNLEQLSTINLEKADDVVQEENLLEKGQILEDEIFLNEVNLLNIQIKKLALAKVSDIKYQPEIVEDLFEDALLSFPDILLEQEKFIEDMSQVSIKLTETQKLSEIQQISEKKGELENISKLNNHLATLTKDGITEITKELRSQAKDENYAKELESEEMKLKAKINNLRWQRYNLEHSMKIHSVQSDNESKTDEDSLEKLNILEKEISLNETKLLDNQIKIMALTQVAEIIEDENENIEELIEDALLTLQNVLVEKQNLLSQTTATAVEISEPLQEIPIQESKTVFQAKVSTEKKEDKVSDKLELQEQSVDKKKEELAEIKKDEELQNKIMVETIEKSVTDKTEEKRKCDVLEDEKELKKKETLEIKSVKTTKSETGEDNKEKTIDSKKEDNIEGKTEEKVESKVVDKKDVLGVKKEKNIEIKSVVDVKEKAFEQKETEKVKDKVIGEEKRESVEENTTIQVKDKLLVDDKQKTSVEEKKEQKVESKMKDITVDRTVDKKEKTAEEKSKPKLDSKAADEKQNSMEDKIEGNEVDTEKEKVVEKKKKVEDKVVDKVQEENTELKEQTIENKVVDNEKGKLTEVTKEKMEGEIVDKEKKEEKLDGKTVEAKGVDTKTETHHKDESSEAGNQEILIKLQEYYENMTANEKHEIAKELTVNATDEEYCNHLVTDETKLKAKISDLKWQRYNLEKLSNVAFEQVDNIPDNDTVLEKLHAVVEEISLNEAMLQNIQIKKLALAQVAEIVDKSENLEDLFEDCLLNMPSILQEENNRLVTEPTIMSTIISQIQKVTEEQINVTPKKTGQDDTTTLSPEKEIEQKLDSISKLKEYLTSVSQNEVTEIVEELKSNSGNGNYAKQLDTEETQFKASINDLKLQKHNLEEQSNVIFEKTENIDNLEDLLLEKANVLEHQIIQNEAKLLNTQVKKLALAKVIEIGDVSENIEGLIEDVVLSIPAILQEEEHMIQNVIKIEIPLIKTEVAVSKPLETLIESENQMTTEDIEQLNLHYSSITSAKIAEFIKEWQSDNDEVAYANRLISEEKQLTAAINEINAHKVLLESISTSQNGNSEDLENKINLEQIVILEQEELLLKNRLKDNQIKKIAITNVYVESNEEEKVELLKKIFLNMLNILKEKGAALKGKPENDVEVDMEKEKKLVEKILSSAGDEKIEVAEMKEQDLKKKDLDVHPEKKPELNTEGAEGEVIVKSSIKLQEENKNLMQEESNQTITVVSEDEKTEHKKMDEERSITKIEKTDTTITKEEKSEAYTAEKLTSIENSDLKEKLETDGEDKSTELASKSTENKVEDKDSKEIDYQKQKEIDSQILEKKKQKNLKKSDSKELDTKSEDSVIFDKEKQADNTLDKKTDSKIKDVNESTTQLDSHVIQEQLEEITKEVLDKKSELDGTQKLKSNKKDEQIAVQETQKEEEKQTELSIEPTKEKDKNEKTKTAATCIDDTLEKKVEESDELTDNKKEDKEKIEKKHKSTEVKVSEQKEKTSVILEENKDDSSKKEERIENKILDKKEEAGMKLSFDTSDEKKNDTNELKSEADKDAKELKLLAESGAKEKKNDTLEDKSKKETQIEKELEIQAGSIPKPSDEQEEVQNVEMPETNKDYGKKESSDHNEKTKKKAQLSSKSNDEEKEIKTNEISEILSADATSTEQKDKKDDTKFESNNKIEEKEKTKIKTSTETTTEKTEETKLESSATPSVKKKDETKVKTSVELTEEKQEEVNTISSTKHTADKKEETNRQSPSKPSDEKEDKAEKISGETKETSDPTIKKEVEKPTTSFPEATEKNKKDKKLESPSKSTDEEKTTEPTVEKNEEAKDEPLLEPTVETKVEAKTKLPEPAHEKDIETKGKTSPTLEKNEEAMAKSFDLTKEKKEETKKKETEKKEESKTKSSLEPTEPIIEKKEETHGKTLPESTVEKKEEAKAKSPEPVDEKNIEVKGKTSPTIEKNEEAMAKSSDLTKEKKEETKKKEESKTKSSPKPTEEKKKDKKVKSPSKSVDEENKAEPIVEKQEEIHGKTLPEPTVEKQKETKFKSSEPTDEKSIETKEKISSEPIIEKKEESKTKSSPESTEEIKKDKKLKSPSKSIDEENKTEHIVEKKEEMQIIPELTVENKKETEAKSSEPTVEMKEETKAKSSREPAEKKKKQKSPSKSNDEEKKTEPIVEKKEETQGKTLPEPTVEKEEVAKGISSESTDEKNIETKDKTSLELTIKKKEQAETKLSELPEEKSEETKEKALPETTVEKKTETKVISSESTIEQKEETNGKTSPAPTIERKEGTKSEPSPESTEEIKKDKKLKSPSKSIDEENKTEHFVEKKEEIQIIPELTVENKKETEAKSPEPTVEMKEETKAKSSPEPAEKKKKQKSPSKSKDEEKETKPIVEKKEETQGKTLPEPTVEKEEVAKGISSESTDEKNIETKDKTSLELTIKKKEQAETKLSELPEEKREETKEKALPKTTVEKKTETKVISSESTIEQKEETNGKTSTAPTIERKEGTKSESSPEPTEEKKKDKKLKSPSKSKDEEKETKPIVEKKEETQVKTLPEPTVEKEEVAKGISSESTDEKNIETKDKTSLELTIKKKEQAETKLSELPEEKREETKEKALPETTVEKKTETKVISSESTIEQKEETNGKTSTAPTIERKEGTKSESSPEPTEEKKKDKKLKSPSKSKDEEKETKPIVEKKAETQGKTLPEPTVEKNEEKKSKSSEPIDENNIETKGKTAPEPTIEKKETTIAKSSEPTEEKKEDTKTKDKKPEPPTKSSDEEKEDKKNQFPTELIVEKKEKSKRKSSLKTTAENIEETIVKASSETTDEKKKETKGKTSSEPIIEKKEEIKTESSSELIEEKKKETKGKTSPEPIIEKKEEIKTESSSELIEEKKKEKKLISPSTPGDEEKEDKEHKISTETIVETKEVKVITSPKPIITDKEETLKIEMKEEIQTESSSLSKIDNKEETKLRYPESVIEKKVQTSLEPTVEKKEETKAKSPPKSSAEKKVIQKSPPKPIEENQHDNKQKISEVKIDEETLVSLSKTITTEEKEKKDRELKQLEESKLEGNKPNVKPLAKGDKLHDSKHSKTLAADKKEDKEISENKENGVCSESNLLKEDIKESKAIERSKERNSKIVSKLDEDKSRTEKIERKESISSLRKQAKYIQKEMEEKSKYDITQRKIEDTNTRQLVKDTTRTKDKPLVANKDQEHETTSTDDKIQTYTSRTTYKESSSTKDTDNKKVGISVGRDRKLTEAYEKDIEINKRFGAIPKRIEPSKSISRLKVQTHSNSWESTSTTLSNRQASPSRHSNKYDNIIKDTEILRSFKNADEIKKGYKTIISDYQIGSEVLKQEKQILSTLSDHSKPLALTSTVLSKTYSVEPLLFARSKPRSKYNCNLYSHDNSDHFYKSLRDTRKTHDRIRNLINLSESVTNSLISTNTIVYSDYEKRSRKQRHAIQAKLQISKYIPSIDLNYYDGYNRISQIDRTMDFEPYFNHYFKLPMMYAVYKSNIERSYLYPRRYEVTLYCGFLRRHETIVRGYNRYKYGGYSYPKIIRHDADESFNLNAVKFGCDENCHSYETCRHKSDVKSLLNTTKGKLVLGQKGYMEVCPLRSQYRSIKWRSPDSDKYLKGDAETGTITTRVRSSLVFVSVKPKTANSDHDIPKSKTLRSCTSTSKHSNYYPRLQKSTTMFITQPDSLISVAPGQDITVPFEINPDSNAKVNWTKRSMDVTKNPRFRTETVGNVTKYILRNSNFDDMGTYCLTAENNYSISKAFVTVTVDNNCIYKNTTYYKLLQKHRLPMVGSTRTMPTYSKLQDMQLTTYKPSNVITSYSMVPPIFYTLPHNTVAEIDESARFQVTVGGYPSPTVTWTKDGRVIGCNTKTRVIEKFNTKVLEIGLTTAEDAGTYTITIQNEAGRASASARLDIITMKNKPYNAYVCNK